MDWPALNAGCGADAATETPAVVVFSRRGRRHTVTYFAGETVLETARRGRVPLNSGCETGDCGACMVTVVKGRVWMRANSVLSEGDIAAGITLACQSLPVSRDLEIDLP